MSIITLLDRAGTPVSCQTKGLTGTYKKISSLIKHSNPSTSIYGQQLQSVSVPNLPVDGERFLTYLSREGSVAKIVYPNLFDVSVSPHESDDAIIQKIISILSKTDTLLAPGKLFPDTHPWHTLVSGSDKSLPLSELLFKDDTIKKGIIDALRWKNMDTASKYAHMLKLSLA